MVELPDTVRRRSADPGALADVVGDAQIVAIGENNHGVREFEALREQLVRFLVRELGFGVVALESGFAEGLLVDAWIRGAPGAPDDLARDGFTFRAGDSAPMQALVSGLRESRTRFSGLDVPGSGGSPEPALRLVREHLAEHAPDAVLFVDAAVEATRPYAAANNGAAPARYAGIDGPTRDAATATAALARLVLRVDALGPSDEHGMALHTEPLDDPAPGSVEAAVAAAGLGDTPVLLDLRPARGASGPTSIRHVTTFVPVDVLAGYDALYCLPTQV